MKRLFFCLLTILLFQGVAFAANYDPAIKWRTITTDHFNVHFNEKQESQAAKAAQYLEEAYAKLTPILHWKPWGRTEVVVTDNNDSPNGMSSTLPYNWSLLRLTSPDPDSVLSDYDNWLRTLVFHEYTHILHLDQYGGAVTIPRIILGKTVSPNGTVPGFIREGIATYIETEETTGGRGRAAYANMMLRTAILNNKFPHIDEADGLQWKWPSYESMYIYGVKFLRWIKENYGEEKIMEFNNEMSKSFMLYAVNHQARHVFTDIQFEQKKVQNHYEHVKKEGTPRSKTFYDLWNAWKKELEVKYAEDKAKIEAEGLTEFKVVADKETVLSNPVISPDGKYLAYLRESVKQADEIHLVDLESGKDKVIQKRQMATDIVFSSDSKKLAFSRPDLYKHYDFISDIFVYNIEKKKLSRMTKGERASNPSYSPDGKKVVFVKQDAGRSWLVLYDIASKKMADLKVNVAKSADADFSQFSQPEYSPDGKWMVFSSWRVMKKETPTHYETGRWDIYLGQLSKEGDELVKIYNVTNDDAIDSRPNWSHDGKNIIYASDRSGVNNIYKIALSDVLKKKLNVKKITNVLTGVYEPIFSPDDKELYVQYYNGDGFDIRKTDVAVIPAKSGSAKLPTDARVRIGHAGGNSGTFSLLPEAKGLGGGGSGDGDDGVAFTAPASKKYSPFGKSLFLPRFIIPSIATLDNAVLFSAFTGGADPLYRHTWLGGVNYRTDLTDYIGYFFNYSYNRFKPVFSAGINEYAVNFGNITFIHTDGTLNTVHLYEGRRRLYGGVSYPLTDRQSVGAQYFFEHRRSVHQIQQDEASALNLRNFAGVSLSYGYGKTYAYPASISREHGRILQMNFTMTDRALGASYGNEQKIYAGDYREYIDLPWARHVLALRTAGGMTWGDNLVQGTFTLGGAMGEGTFGGGNSLYYFPLRGLPVASLSRNRAMLMSGEYRIPLFSPQRGFGTLPFFIENFHFAPFVDFGNAWNADQNTGSYFFNYWLLSTGAELRGDFVIGHGLPFSGRLGYGIVVKNRGRLGDIRDPLLNTPAKNGMLVLQLGTSF